MNEVTFGKHLGMDVGHQETQPVIRGLELSAPPPDFWGEERD